MRVFSVAVGVMAVLVGGLLVGAPAGVATARADAVVAGTTVSTVAVTADVSGPVLAQEPGPKLDPQTEADAENTKNKAIVGGAAAVLLLIVLYGRHVRAKRKAKK